MQYLCPRCEQDYVIRARITKFEKDFVYCPECEACWDNETSLRTDNQVYSLTFTDLPTLLGYLKLDYSDIADVGSM